MSDLPAHPESYGHWDHCEISDLLHERDRLRAHLDALRRLALLAATASATPEQLRELAERCKE